MLGDLHFSVWGLLGGLLFGTYGLYLFRRGKKEGEFSLLMIGIILLVYPYFVSNDIILWGIGSSLVGFAYLQHG